VKTHSEIKFKKMKLFKNISFAAALLFATALLIAAFIVLFSYADRSPKDQSKENSADGSAVVSESSIELKN
jgi:hypothetical protein